MRNGRCYPPQGILVCYFGCFGQHVRLEEQGPRGCRADSSHFANREVAGSGLLLVSSKGGGIQATHGVMPVPSRTMPTDQDSGRCCKLMGWLDGLDLSHVVVLAADETIYLSTYILCKSGSRACHSSLLLALAGAMTVKCQTTRSLSMLLDNDRTDVSTRFLASHSSLLAEGAQQEGCRQEHTPNYQGLSFVRTRTPWHRPSTGSMHPERQG